MGVMRVVLLLAVFLSLTNAVIPPLTNRRFPCIPYRTVLTEVLVEYAEEYFTDNAGANGIFLEPDSNRESNPSALFTAIYGPDASSRNFEQVILRMLYADPGPMGPQGGDRDRILLRNNIYASARIGTHPSLDLAREKFGLLLYLDVEEEVNPRFWFFRCIPQSELKYAKPVMNVELIRLRNQLGEDLFGRFLELGTGTSLSVAIDTTGSMRNVIQSVKERVESLLSRRLGSVDQPQDFVLAPFNDPEILIATVTTNPSVFNESVFALTANGGGDLPELALGAILQAIENSRFGSTIFVFTDADVKDVELQHIVVSQAQQKDISITFVLTSRIRQNICTGESLSSRDELYNVRCNTPSFLFGQELYDYIANRTNGRTLFFRRENAASLVLDPVEQSTVDLVLRTVNEDTENIFFNVDSTVSEVFIKLSGACFLALANIESTLLQLLDVVTTDNTFEGRIPVNENFGSWRLVLSFFPAFIDDTPCRVRVTGRSSFGVIMTLAKFVPSRRGIVLERFDGRQLLSRDADSTFVLIDAFGRHPLTEIKTLNYVDPNTGENLASQTLSDQRSNNFRVPLADSLGGAFLISVSGTDDAGHDFTRVLPREIEFVDVEIRCNDFENVVFRPNNVAVVVSFSIANFGPFPDSFDLGVYDNQNRFVVAGSLRRTSVDIDPEGSVDVEFEIAAGTQTPIGTPVDITITAKSPNSPFMSPIATTCRLVVGQKSRPTIRGFDIKTDITTRFAQTVITSTVDNNENVARDSEFFALLPANAFISNFTIEKDGSIFVAEIVEQDAIIDLNLVSHVAAREFSDRVFRTFVRVEGNSVLTMRLTYQQIVRQESGKYVFELSIAMPQAVDGFAVEIELCETNEIQNLRTTGFRSQQSTEIQDIGATIVMNGNNAQVVYRPQVSDQTRFSPFGLNGRFAIEYSVANSEGGNFLAVDGGIVHFYTPDFPVLPKQVVFALDISGSMFRRKYQQLREAMDVILDELTANDNFNIIVFNTNTRSWIENRLVPGTEENINNAKEFLSQQITEGGTDILTPLEMAIDLLDFSQTPDSSAATDFVVFLTDGRPTVRDLSSESILNTITDLNGRRFGINTIGFGTLVDAQFLSALAARNLGSFVQIFEDIDANIQISNFYEQISVPILTDVEIGYSPGIFEAVSDNRFNRINRGQELIIVAETSVEQLDGIPYTFQGRRNREGRVNSNMVALPADLSGICIADSQIGSRLKNLLDMNGLLRQLRAASESEELRIRNFIIEQSFRLNLVAPSLTTLVILQPSADSNPRRKTLSKRISEDTAPQTRIQQVQTYLEIKNEVKLNPQIVLQLHSQLSVCFNWTAKPNQIYKVVHDIISGIAVNAKFVKNPGEQYSNTLISEIGIVFANHGLKVTVMPDVVRVEVGESQKWRFLNSVQLSTHKRGVLIEITPASEFSSTVTVSIKNRVQFQMTTHNGLSDVVDHIDLRIEENTGFSDQVTGILAIFPREKDHFSADVMFVPYESDHANLHLKNKELYVENRSIYNPNSRQFTKCWFLNDLNTLVGKNIKGYTSLHLLQKPKK